MWFVWLPVPGSPVAGSAWQKLHAAFVPPQVAWYPVAISVPEGLWHARLLHVGLPGSGSAPWFSVPARISPSS